MCNHVLSYPEDTRENYNPDGETLTGVCKHCGAKQKAYGMRYMIPRHDNFLKEDPFGEVNIIRVDRDEKDYLPHKS